MRSTGGPEETQAQRIEAILADDDPANDALEYFIDRVLVSAGVFHARWSDGIVGVRFLERSPTHVRVVGQMWHIDQHEHVFWLDLAARADTPAWTLYFDIAPNRSARFRRNAVHLISAPEEVEWQVVVASEQPTSEGRA